MRAVLVLSLLAVSVTARADWLSREVDKIDRSDAAGGGGGGGSGSGSNAEPNMDDLNVWAGEPRTITLPEVLQIAVRQAPTLQSARYDIAVAEAQISETWARHDWLVGATANYAKQLSLFAGRTIDSTNYGGTLDVSRLLPTGGTIDIHADTTYSHSNFSGLVSDSWQVDADLQIKQSLLKGRGMWLYDANERKAQLVRDFYVLARRSVAINTVQTVISSYWDLVLAERQVAITQASLDLARERLRVTEIGARGGKIADAEIPAVQQIIATREEDVLNGELAVLNASIALRRAAGLPIGAGDLGLRVTTELDIRDRDTTLAPLVDRTYAASPELAQLAKQDAAGTIDIEVNDNGLLPQLDAMLSLGPSGQENPFIGAAKDTVQLKNITIAGSLTFSRALGQEDIRYRSRELRAVREKLRVNAFDIRAQLAQGVARAVAGLELAKRRTVLSARAIELAKENIRIETDRFNLGTRTNFDVLNRLEDLRQAELRQAQAQIDWHKAETVVMALTGDLLPAYGISVE